MDGSGNVTAVNTFGAGGLVSRHVAAGSTFYTFDTQGSTVERLDSSQNVLSIDVFDAFGKLLSGTASDPWGYEAQDGYFTDTETGLSSLSYRYYDPAQGRFLNRDPIGFGGGINLYGYVGNDSPARSDALGLMAGPVPIEGGPIPGTAGLYPPMPDLGFWGTVKLLGPMVLPYHEPLPPGTLNKIHGFFPWFPAVEGADGASGGEEMLTRYASGKESVNRLARGCKDALERSRWHIHGVSVTAGEPDLTKPHARVPRSTVEASFPVHDTPSGPDPLHRTVELPDPVDEGVADLWNSIWRFGRL